MDGVTLVAVGLLVSQLAGAFVWFLTMQEVRILRDYVLDLEDAFLADLGERDPAAYRHLHAVQS